MYEYTKYLQLISKNTKFKTQLITLSEIFILEEMVKRHFFNIRKSNVLPSASQMHTNFKKHFHRTTKYVEHFLINNNKYTHFKYTFQ